jgi:hypothetical protein
MTPNPSERRHPSPCGQNVANPKRKLIFFVTLILATNHCSLAYIPGVNRRTIAGLWKLVHKKKSSRRQQQFPLKEFTVYPKDKEKDRQRLPRAALEEDSTDSNANEILLMLKEDGSFQQYAADDRQRDQEVTIPDKLTLHKEDDAFLDSFFGRIQGKWDYVDGKLILAADRPENNPKVEDTLLVGEVVAKKEESLADNPIVQNTTDIEQNTIKPSKFDTHLSVPKGKVNVGKFFYPKQHPSFFEQPMFSPTTKGKFELKQVLGSLNAQNPEVEEELIEKFRQTDFHDKRFLLTSHPLGRHRPKGNIRWSIKYNRYVGKFEVHVTQISRRVPYEIAVQSSLQLAEHYRLNPFSPYPLLVSFIPVIEDTPSRKAMEEAEDEQNRLANIRVMEFKFFSNNTFATVGGLGESILRGKYHIVGQDRDHLWMQVWRFGFGRAVSGSVYR